MKHLRFTLYCFFILILIIATYPCASYAIADTSALSIESPSAILVHFDTGTVLFEKNAKERMYPASTTKIMTAILVLESGHDLSELATVSENAVTSVPEGYSHANLEIGEQFTLEQLLYVLLLPSANDAANVLAEYIGGSVSAFAELMNAKANEIGCEDTHFVNPSGIHSENHYSTAYDLSLIGRYAMQNATFRNIVQTTSYSLPATDKHPVEDRTFTNTNRLLDSSDPCYYPDAIGIKTGYTTPAGDCLVSGASHDGLNFIAVVLGGSETEDRISQRYSDTIKLFHFAYGNYTLFRIKEKGSIVKKVEVNYATHDTKDLNLLCDRDITAFTETQGLTDTLLPEITLNENIEAPIQEGEILGSIRYNILGISYEANLIAQNDVERESILPLVQKTLFIALLFLAIGFICFRGKKTNYCEIDNIRL